MKFGICLGAWACLKQYAEGSLSQDQACSSELSDNP
jgi:hypothetical protein